MIVTFYSYKGGVGRSMALANVAEWYRRQGLRVVMVDWDLEAPGLETFFAADPEGREAIRGRLGLVDLLQTYRELFPGLARPSEAAAGSDAASPSPDRLGGVVTMLQQALSPLRHMLVPLRAADDAALPPLWLLPAGNRSAERFDSYAETVQQFDWTDFYARFEGEAYFEWMRRQMLDADLADVVLIDSRTGVTEMSGVCTRQLADVVVMLCAPNDQNLDGVAKMARSFVRPELAAARAGGPIQLVMVPSRIDVAEGRPIDLFESKFHSRLDGFLPAAFRAARTEFSKLRIPYISAYAFEEHLAVGDPEGVKALQQAYGELATHLALLAPPHSALRTRCTAALHDRFGLPAVVVVTLAPRREFEAEVLRHVLSEEGLIVLPAPAGIDAAVEFVAGFGDAQRQALSVVAVAGDDDDAPDAAALRSLRNRLREAGVALRVVTQAAPAGSTQLHELVQALRAPAAQPRVPMLAPPPGRPVVGRQRELAMLRDALLEPGSGRPRTIALYSLGGAGKTVLGRALARDDAVVDHFDGGVLWITLGRQPDLRAGLGKMLAAFEGSSRSVADVDIDELQRRLAEHLQTRRCLIVVEDAESAAALEGVPRGGAQCVTLVTTRSREIAASVARHVVRLGGLDSAEASRLLLDELPAPADAGTAALEIVRIVDALPLALLAANRVLRSRVQRGAGIDAALAELSRRLQHDGLTAVDAAEAQGSEASVFAALMLDTEQLTAADRRKLHRLAQLPEAAAFDIDAAAQAVELPPGQTAGMLERLVSIGWVAAGPSEGQFEILPLARALLRSLAMREELAAHTRTARAAPGGLKIYLSYARREAGSYVRMIQGRLAEEFGAEALFFDQTVLQPGEDWSVAIERAVSEATAAVVVIGPNWLPLPDAMIHELASLLKHDTRVIPVLVNGAVMPSRAELPIEVASIAERNALAMDDASFNRGMDMIVEVLRSAGDGLAGSMASAASTSTATIGPFVRRLVDAVRLLVQKR